MLTKSIKAISLLMYGLYVLYLGEIIMIRYSKSMYEMYVENSKKYPKPENFILFNLIILFGQHVLATSVNISIIYFTIIYAFY